MWYMYHPLSWETIIFGGLFIVLAVAALAALFLWIFRPHTGPNRPAYAEGGDQPRPAHDALEIVRECYARGEISKSEYEQIRDDLKT